MIRPLRLEIHDNASSRYYTTVLSVFRLFPFAGNKLIKKLFWWL